MIVLDLSGTARWRMMMISIDGRPAALGGLGDTVSNSIPRIEAVTLLKSRPLPPHVEDRGDVISGLEVDRPSPKMIHRTEIA